MQETALRNPALSLDQVLVHGRNLPGRPPEAEKAQAKPVEESLPEGGGRRGDVKRMFVHGKGTGGNGRGRRPRAAVAMLSLSGTHPVTDSRTGPTLPRPGSHVRSHSRRNHKGFLHRSAPALVYFTFSQPHRGGPPTRHACGATAGPAHAAAAPDVIFRRHAAAARRVQG